MSEQFHRKFNVFLNRTRTTEGKITIFTSIVACFVLVCVFVIFNVNVPQAVAANNVQTSVTVLNTPPAWTVDAQESTESSTSTPTNAGSTLSFTATGTDSSGDNYYLLICKTSGAPTPNNGAAPTCNGGNANQWAVSAATVSGAQATASTSTIDTFPFNAESNDWWGWICDANATFARCNVVSKQGSSVTASPFVINHIPRFFSVSNDGPIIPGGTITWTSVSNDPDTLGGNDQVRLLVCKAPGVTNGVCTGAGGAFATSTLAASNAATSTPFPIPAQDRWYNAYVYIVDDNNLAATSTIQGSISGFAISNVAPSIATASVSFQDYDNTAGLLTLTVPSATSGPFKVKFTVADNNGCLNASSTAEIATTSMNTYRSGIASTSCMNTTGHYDSNSCYPANSGNFSPFLTCTQDAASCSGATDSDATFTCTYSLWFNADPTDASTQYTAQNWLATVRAQDNNGLVSGYTDSTSFPAELQSFLAYSVSTTTVGYGALQPGDTTTPLVATTDLRAVGNVGLDENLYGDTMCTNWTSADSCDSGGINPASEIPVSQQKVATSSIAYTSAVTLTSSSSPTAVTINVPKTIATSTIQSRNTYWGIAIPVSITLAGNYTGQNTITGVKSAPANW
jgi:hypothetical protein